MKIMENKDIRHKIYPAEEEDGGTVYRSRETGDIVGILRHSVGPWGDSTGVFAGMEGTNIVEVGGHDIGCPCGEE
jgi:hypothetical protein